jgi:hypothetical protein
MKIERIWAMPNKNTFTIPPINSLIRRHVHGKSIDPFANVNKLAMITNDIDPMYPTGHHLDALDFLKMFDDENIDSVLFDPPYSARQISEVYTKMGKSVNMETTQASFWAKLKKEISRITKMDGIVVSCGWNSGGIGKKYGFELLEVLLVPHGGHHNDTIVTVEKKIQKLYKSDDTLIE